ncbi:hypothetical protein [Salisaeta longa]|uniref:hypothetical protein n=1 Tax=Salisaeta longa TaxID=503170 RepID=UPI0003B53526|nr:hypothetical protein [Salisaeta longa]
MSDTLFLITGGGTGAKVAESFVHLCAAGLAPPNVHILMIDTDATNGNVQRAASTEKAYSNLQQYPWSVDTTVKESGWNPLDRGSAVGTRLFSTTLRLYPLTDPLDTVTDGGLKTMVGDDRDMRQVLELFFDESERSAKCDDGFRARPNLGCLHITNHLNNRLRKNKHAQRFLSALGGAGNGATAPVPIVVTASVFGGTGASLLPVVRGCVERALKEEGHLRNLEALTWNAVKILPHYRPTHRKESVDPDRFLLDTASALQFYSKVYGSTESSTYEGVYLIGSDNPARNTVEPSLGSEKQSNPSYFEEFLGALAVLDAANAAGDSHARPIRAFVPNTEQSSIGWKTLPYANGEELKEQWGYLLHLAAFYLHEGGRDDLSKGLERLLRSISPDHLQHFGWYRDIIDPWAENNPSYKGASKNRRPEMIQDDASLGSFTYGHMRTEVAEYFGRLLLWAETALNGPSIDLLDYDDSDYAAVHSAMSQISPDDVNTRHAKGESRTIAPDEDNAMIRTLRAALAAMIRLSNNDRRVKTKVATFNLIKGNRIPLAITRGDVEAALSRNGLHSVPDGYTRTAVTA